MRAIIIDPSCFTMQYDHYLCESIASQNHEVFFIGSRYLYENFNYLAHYKRLDFFYNFTNFIYSYQPSGFLRKEIKGIEHVVDMIRLVGFVKENNPDVIHFQWVPFPALDELFLIRLKKVAPVILTVHDANPYHNTPSSKLQLIRFGSILKKFDHLIVHTQSCLKTITEKWGLPNEKISIIPHGLFSHYHKNRMSDYQKLSLENRYNIVFFGTIKPYKGVDILIRACARLPNDILEKCKFIIAGVPRMNTDYLKKLAEELKVDKYFEWHLRFISEDEVGDILSDATIFVLPYTNEFEAQSGALMALLPFGKPIIASRISCFVEVLSEANAGYLVEVKNPVELANVILSLLMDREKREIFGERALKLARRYSAWSDIAQKTIEIYKKVAQDCKD